MPGSGRAGTGRRTSPASAIAAAIASAVAAVRASGEWAISTGGVAGIGRAGGSPGRARRAATRRAWAGPSAQLGLRLALEPAFDDERRFAVADEDERRVEPGRDQRRCLADASDVSARSRAGSSTAR